MLYNLPYKHSVLDDCEGDPALIARKLLDIVDRSLPPAGAWSVIYLLFNPADEHHLWFSSANAAGAVCAQLLETYRRETELLKTCSLEQSPALAWRFELLPTEKASVFELKYASSAFAALATVEVVFSELAEGVLPGMLHAVMRSQPVLEDGAQLLAVSEAASPLVHVAHHVDRFQRGLRWARPALYLTERWNQFTVGPLPTCEFVCESLRGVWTVKFQTQEGRWQVAWADRDGVPVYSAEEQTAGKLSLLDEAVGVCVEGRALSPSPTFEAQMKENRVPLYDLTVVSRLLPLGPARGYGYVADELRRSLEGNVQSCVRLSADGSYLYLNEYEQVFALDYGGATPRQIHSGDRIALGDLLMTWQTFAEESGEDLSGFFCGQLVFEKPTIRRLASNGISVSLREAFVTHYDEFQVRARLVSRDGLNFLLRFAEGTKAAPVWVKPDERKGFQLHAGGDAGWRFEDSPIEFVIGSTRFRLTAEGASD
jgi:hypothetical protein